MGLRQFQRALRPEIDAEAASAVDSAIERLAALDMKEARLDLCRGATKHNEDWPQRIRARLKDRPQLGSFSHVMEVCLAYLNGRRDALLETSK